MEEFSVDRRPATLRGTESGRGAGVTFLHAGVADRRSWLQVMAIVSDLGMRCVAYDQRGYGDTKSADVPFSHRDDLAAVLDDRGLDRTILVGASRGGQIALDSALADPERVLALLLIGSAPRDARFPPPSEAVIELSGAIERAERDGDLPHLNELEARLWLDGPMAPPGRVAGPIRDLFLDMNGRAITAAASGTADPFEPTAGRLQTMRMPVSILVGELDMPGLLAAAKETAEQIKTAHFRVLSDTAHLPMLEQPAVIAQEVADLLARV